MESTDLNSIASATISSPDLTGNCQDGRQTLSTSKDRVIVSSACIPCRNKHLKCDGLCPFSRCHSQVFHCTYAKSRRGYKSRSRTVKQAAPLNSLGCPLLSAYAMTPCNSRLGVESIIAPELINITALQDPALGGVSLQLAPKIVRKDGPGQTLEAKCRERCLKQALQMPRTGAMNHLQTAMCYIGAQYVSTGSAVAFAQELDSLISAADVLNDGSMVKALLLYAIGLDGNNQHKKALEVLFRAQNLALQIGMHQNDFAVLNGAGSLILEESWRRTWWELYVVDGIIAGLHQQRTFRLNGIVSNVLVPCEEREYASGHIPPSRTIEEFEDLPLSYEDIQWSSYAYRIAAIRNLGRILQLKETVFPDDPLIDALDAYLIKWKLHLPDSKKVFIDSDGQVDEMLFQAHMITDVSSILLHRPRWSAPIIAPTTTLAQESSPEQQIRMNIGALKAIAEVWTSAKVVLDQVTNVAREIYEIRKAAAAATAMDRDIWVDFTVEEEDMRGITEDVSLMDGFQLE